MARPDGVTIALDAAVNVRLARGVSTIHFIGGEKGGVGKSVIARLLSQWFIDRSVPFAAIDADRSHGTLARTYGENTQSVDLGDFASADEIIDRALAADRRVVVDMPAQSSRLLERWMQSADLVRFCEQVGIRLTLWHVTDGGFDSTRDLERTLTQYGAQFAYVAVRNHGRSKDFGLFDASPARARLEELKGRILDIPELDLTAMNQIDRTSASFWAAANNSAGDGSLPPMQRQRVRRWLTLCYEGFQGLGDIT